MRQGQQNRRGRGRNNNNNNNNNNPHRKGQHHHNPLMRTYQSNGPDQKIHGTPAQIAEKYMSLARDALSSGDHVLAENYLQHAEHYNRIILTYREQQIQQGGGDVMNNGMPRHRPFPNPGEPFEGGSEGGEDGEDASGDQSQMSMRPNEPQPRMFDQGQPRHDDRPRQQGDQGGRGDRDRDYGQGHQQRDRDGGGRDRDNRDGNRNFRQRDQRFGHDRGGEMRGDRDQRNDRERFPRGENGERHERFDRNDRQDRGPRPNYGDRPDRGDRGDRGERPERVDRPERVERVDRVDVNDRPIAAGAGEIQRPVEAAAPQPVVDAAPPVARRRERFVAEPASEQPEFLRRPVRRPRREAGASDGPDAAPPARRTPATEPPSSE